MAGDPRARLRQVLGLGPRVILSDDEITKGLALLPEPEADEVRAQLESPPEPPVRRFVFGGVPR